MYWNGTFSTIITMLTLKEEPFTDTKALRALLEYPVLLGLTFANVGVKKFGGYKLSRMLKTLENFAVPTFVNDYYILSLL